MAEEGLLGTTWGFTKGFVGGVYTIGEAVVVGAGQVVVSSYDLATNPQAREEFWNATVEMTNSAGDYVEDVYNDPVGELRDIRDGVVDAYDEFDKARIEAGKQGESGEFWGKMLGEKILDFNPAGKLAKLGRLGIVGDDAGSATKQAKKVEDDSATLEDKPVSSVDDCSGKNKNPFEKGKKIGEGGFGTVYEIADQPNLVMKEATASSGKANAQLVKEANDLKLLTDKGYPTVFKEFVQWTDADGVVRQAIIMEKVDGVLSKEILQTGKFEGITPSPSSLNLVNKKTIQELRQFRDKAASDNLVIEDLQFMLDKSGSIHLIDPATVKDLSGLKSKQSKPQSKAYLKRIDRMIKDFEKNLP